MELLDLKTGDIVRIIPDSTFGHEVDTLGDMVVLIVPVRCSGLPNWCTVAPVERDRFRRGYQRNFRYKGNEIDLELSYPREPERVIGSIYE